MALQMGSDRLGIEGLQAQADVVEVPPCRAAGDASGCSRRPREVSQIDLAAPARSWTRPKSGSTRSTGQPSTA